MKLKNNRGFILLFSYFIIVMLIGFGAALFFRSVNEKLFAEQYLNLLKAGYAAEEGISMIATELLTHGEGWATHDAIPDDPANPTEYSLAAKTNPPQVTAGMGTIDAATGCYVKTNADGTRFAAKAYADPHSPSETVILVKGFSNTVSRLKATKLSQQSLYNYFIFTPYNFYVGWRSYDAYGGQIHANGNIVLYENASIKNASKLSTASAIRYQIYSFVPPGNCGDMGETQCGESLGKSYADIYWEKRSPKTLPNAGPINGIWGYGNDYVNQSDGHLYGDKTGILMWLDPANPALGTTTWNGTAGRELLPDDHPELYFNPAGEHSAVKFENDIVGSIPNFSIAIPNRLSGGQTYPWNIFEEASNSYGYPPNYVNMNYTDSQALSTSWLDFLRNNGTYNLENLIQDGNTTSPVTAKEINPTSYSTKASQNGIEIMIPGKRLCPSGSPYAAQINGSNTLYCAEASGANYGKIRDGSTTLMELKTFYNASTGNQDEVIAVHLSSLIFLGYSPNNGIIYSFPNVLIDSATNLPNSGLTIVGSNSIYLKGDFNKFPHRLPEGGFITPPAAAIAAGNIYLLSKNFNYPQALPATMHNPNYPDVSDESIGWDAPDSALPNTAAATTYVISLVGYYSGQSGFEPRVLERWVYGGQTATMTITGGFVQLPEENFRGFFDPEENKINKVRCLDAESGSCPYDGCAYPPCCRDCRPKSEGGYERYFPDNMTTVSPASNKMIFRYNRNYLNPTSPRPPGDLLGFTQSIQLDLDDTDYNWNHHYLEIF